MKTHVRRVVCVAIAALTFAVAACRGEASSTLDGQPVRNTGHYAILDTDRGNIVLELYPAVAPKTVANFEKLSKDGFYNNLTFHRVEPGFVVQGGDPQGNGMGGRATIFPPRSARPRSICAARSRWRARAIRSIPSANRAAASSISVSRRRLFSTASTPFRRRGRGDGRGRSDQGRRPDQEGHAERHAPEIALIRKIMDSGGSGHPLRGPTSRSISICIRIAAARIPISRPRT